MELKKVSQEISKGYAKKDEISNKEIKKFTPAKWLTASAAGLVTLLYTSPNNSIHKIGLVFGCIEIGEPYYNYSSLWHVANTIMDVFYYVSWVLGVAFIFSFVHHMIKSKEYDEEKRLKSVKNIKILAILLVIAVLITGALVFVLQMDIDEFYENGIKNSSTVTNSKSINNLVEKATDFVSTNNF